MWGVIPAAGRASRLQPLAFSKELLPIGSKKLDGIERPMAAAEHIMARMVKGGATRLCMVVAPGKADILKFSGSQYARASICYAVQEEPAGLCDALFRAAPFIAADEPVMVGLPDTVWYPQDGFQHLPDDTLSFLLFPAEHPQHFDAVACEGTRVTEIQVKHPAPRSRWIWGAFKMPGRTFLELHDLWLARGRVDEFIGTLINAWIAQGGLARGIPAGRSYADAGTLSGYRAAEALVQQEHA